MSLDPSDKMRPIPAEQTALSRRRFLKSTAAGLLTIAISDLVWAQATTRSPAKPIPPDVFSVPSPVSIEVHARPIASFDRNDHTRGRFGALEYRSGRDQAQHQITFRRKVVEMTGMHDHTVFL